MGDPNDTELSPADRLRAFAADALRIPWPDTLARLSELGPIMEPAARAAEADPNARAEAQKLSQALAEASDAAQAGDIARFSDALALDAAPALETLCPGRPC